MPLLPPTVVGPLSECNTYVRVQNQLSGSTVTIFANGAPVGGGPATWSDDVFPLTPPPTLPPGAPILAPGANITVTQALGSDTSPPSSDLVLVQKKPPIVGTVGFASHLYVCGGCLRLDGMVPGATVQVFVGPNSSTPVRADDGTARVHLSAPIGAGQAVKAQQTACGQPGLVTAGPTPDPVPTPPEQYVISSPIVRAPLYECERTVTIDRVWEGATVKVISNLGLNVGDCFDFTSEYFIVNPLKLGEAVTASQSFPRCKLGSAASSSVVAASLEPVPVPWVEGPLCAGGTHVPVHGLIRGARVHILQDGNELGVGEAPDPDPPPFEVPPLTAGKLVTVRQELCGKWSDPSPPVKVSTQPATLPKPIIPGPLYQCAAVVRVQKVHPGSMVYLISQLLGGVIGSKWSQGTEVDIAVRPRLIKDDKVHALVVGCGRQVSSAPAKKVLGEPKLSPPTIQTPIDDCMSSVTVNGVVPGARVEVEADGIWSGPVTAGGSSVVVNLSHRLSEGQAMRARQSLCGPPTRLGPVVKVGHAPRNYVTGQYDVRRTGWNACEKILTVARVKAGFGQVAQAPLKETIYAQPLYVEKVSIPGKGVHNVVVVATQDDSIYLFDADQTGDLAPLVPKKSLVPPGERAWVLRDVGDNRPEANPPRPDPFPGSGSWGITGTPVIDVRSRTIYAVAATVDNAWDRFPLAKKLDEIDGKIGAGLFHFRLHALDLSTLNDKPGSPVELSPPNFYQRWQIQRTALLLSRDHIYIGLGSIGADKHTGLYRGWVLSYDAKTLQQRGVFNAAPDAIEDVDAAAGVWQSGCGPAADTDGFIYCVTGNGLFTASQAGRDYGNSVIKLQQKDRPPALTAVDYFTPGTQSLLNGSDQDLGSGGALVLPDQIGPFPKLLLACGKEGTIYLLNREDLGGYTAPSGDANIQANCHDRVVQELWREIGGVPKDTSVRDAWLGGPAYYAGPTGTFIYYAGREDFYYAGREDFLRAFRLHNGRLSSANVSHSPSHISSGQTAWGRKAGGLQPVVSSDGDSPGTGVVWGIPKVDPFQQMQLVAYDATDLTQEIFRGNISLPPDYGGGRWKYYGAIMLFPTVANGRVYVAIPGGLVAFGPT